MKAVELFQPNKILRHIRKFLCAAIGKSSYEDKLGNCGQCRRSISISTHPTETKILDLGVLKQRGLRYPVTVLF